jgi:spore germination cell wall hydrolase CwlJ-like protein
MLKSLRSALLICAALAAMNIAPAEAGPSGQTLATSANAALPDLSIKDLIDPHGQPTLATPDIAPDEAAPVVDETPVATAQPAVDRDAGLDEMVASLRSSETGTRELECLATGVYFESKSEPLSGQLAVGHVIANRAASNGRFPSSYCGVLFQRGQFSFVHGKSLPSVPKASRQWKTAVAIAKIVDQKLKNSAVGKALFFHARYVSPNWRLKRVAAIGNHIFYR